MNYIVTGGAGFIGSHLIELLISKGHYILCIDDLSSGYEHNLPFDKSLTFLKRKLEDVETSRTKKFDGIFHLAAQASVPKSIDDFYNSSKNNLLGTLKVFEWARNAKIPVVYASSSAIYGNLPVGNDEVENYDILSPYAQDKLTMEHYADMAWKVYQVKSIGLRFFNVYGPRQDPANPYSGVISIFIDRLLKQLPVTVNGGYQTRDFVYVKDVVNCLYKSMEMLLDKPMCDALNVGTGKSIMIDELLRILIEIIKYNPEIIKAELPKGDPEVSSGTYKKLEKILGIASKDFISLTDGLAETVKYFRHNG